MRNPISWALLLIVLVLLGWFLFRGDKGTDVPNDTNVLNENVLPVVGTQASTSEIVIDTPKLGDKITSPLTVTGRARGSWYFEASAPVSVVDATGKILGQGYVMAEGEWMTTEFVPFSGTVSFSGGTTEGGAVIFMNDNPSGEPSRSRYWAIPVFLQ